MQSMKWLQLSILIVCDKLVLLVNTIASHTFISGLCIYANHCFYCEFLLLLCICFPGKRKLYEDQPEKELTSHIVIYFVFNQWDTVAWRYYNFAEMLDVSNRLVLPYSFKVNSANKSLLKVICVGLLCLSRNTFYVSGRMWNQ